MLPDHANAVQQAEFALRELRRALLARDCAELERCTMLAAASLQDWRAALACEPGVASARLRSLNHQARSTLSLLHKTRRTVLALQGVYRSFVPAVFESE